MDNKALTELFKQLETINKNLELINKNLEHGQRMTGEMNETFEYISDLLGEFLDVEARLSYLEKKHREETNVKLVEEVFDESKERLKHLQFRRIPLEQLDRSHINPVDLQR